MTLMTGTFETAHASKYLQQLCKHFQHKVSATFDDTSGTVALPLGAAQLSATDDRLTVRIDLADPEDAGKGKHVIDSHLARFAFREDFTAMTWDH